MAFIKCPRCELNYMQTGDKYCQVCRREMHGEDDHDAVLICTNCGERVAVQGEELCAICLKEITNTEGFAVDNDEEEAVDESIIELPGASEIEEIEIDDEAIPAGEFQVIRRELCDDEDADSDFNTISLDELQEKEESAGEEDEED